MSYLCMSCGGDEPIQDGVACSSCGLRHFVLNAETGNFELRGFPVGFIVEGDPTNPEGRRVENRPASGGISASSIRADGSFDAHWSGSLDRGRKGEGHVTKVLLNKLKQLGRDVREDGDARDDLGEDGIRRLDGTRVPLQIVTVPSHSSAWKELHLTDTATITGSSEDAIALLRDAILAKSAKAGGALLALDLSHVGAIVSRVAVERYLARYGDPAVEFSFHSVWLVGPTPRSTLELRSLEGSV